MFEKFRNKIARSISDIKIPNNSKLDYDLLVPSSVKIIRPFNRTSIGIVNPLFIRTSISNNILFNLIILQIDFYLIVTEESNGFSYFYKYETEIEKEIISNFPKSKELLEEIDSEISSDLLFLKPKIIELEIGINCIIASFDKDFISLAHVINSDIPISLFYNQSINIYEINFLFEKIINRNVFQPLGKIKHDGKNFENKFGQPKNLFGEVSQEGFYIENGSRKSYRVISRNAHSTRVKMPSFWDLLYPLLLPPLNFNFKEYLDLYGELWPFQQQGVQFLYTHASALLADEMGTGKTVQAIIALRLLYRKALIKKTLIVCPLSILGSSQLSLKTGKSEGWDGHLFNWAPELTVTVVRGNDEQRRMDWNYPSHVYITTYDVLRNDIESGLLESKSLQFDCIIVDEAQNIKNRNSGKSKAVKKLSGIYRWALTGTPIENRVEDVISIFDFVKPHLFSSILKPKQFNDIIEPNLFTKGDYEPQSVKRIIEPYFLRRLKRDVLKELPEKIRQEEWLELDEEQQIAYDRILHQGRNKIISNLESENEFTIRAHIFTLLTELKKICNFAPDRETSPKTKLLLDYIETIIQNEAKLLVFSQYTEFGINILEKLLNKNDIKYVTIKGDISLPQRNIAIDNFRNPNLKIPILLGSVKAAGVGISLTEASYVIHFDHWWNPAVMWQAEDRAHRPGQKNKLNVYSFWMRNTIEERIKEKLHEKGLLIENVIDSLATSVIDKMISTDEWLDILGISHSYRSFTETSTKTVEEIVIEIQKMDPIEFENITKNFFIKLGYPNSKVTQRTRDGGIDVFGSRKVKADEETFVAQCKRTDIVGVNVARELLGVMADNSRITKGFIVTSGMFSDDCIRFSNANPKINLIDGVTYAKYIKELKLL